MKSFSHTSPEVKRLARQIVLQLYKLNGTIIHNNFGMQSKFLKPVLVKSIVDGMDKIDIERQKDSPIKARKKSAAMQDVFGSIKEEEGNREHTPMQDSR